MFPRSLCVSTKDVLDPDLGECSIMPCLRLDCYMTSAGIHRFLSALLPLNITKLR